VTPRLALRSFRDLESEVFFFDQKLQRISEDALQTSIWVLMTKQLAGATHHRVELFIGREREANELFSALIRVT
jgi:hypothetical protein